MPETLEQQIQLHYDRIDKENRRQPRPCIILNKSHQEAKTNQHHHIDILVHRVIILIELAIAMRLNFHKDSIEDDNYYLYDCEED